MNFKSFFLYIISILLLISSFSVLVAAHSAMGVTPGFEDFVYIGQDKIVGVYTLLPDGEKNIKVRPASGLAEHLYFEDGSQELEMHVTGPTKIPFTINLPKDLKPGTYTTKIINSQYLTPEERVQKSGFSAFAAMAFVINVRVPNDGKFLEISIDHDPDNIKLGDVVYFNVNMLNFGTEDLYNLQTNLVISKPDGEVLTTHPTTKVDLLSPGQRDVLMGYWETEGYTHGSYDIEAKIFYGGDVPAETMTTFKVGDIFIEIVNVSTHLEDDVGRINVDIKSHWNELIPNVYAEIDIKSNGQVIDTLKTSAVDLAAWGNERLTAFWEKGDLLAGDYEIDINVFYYDKEAKKQMKVRLDDEENAAPAFDGSLMTIVIILLVVVFLINMIWFIYNMNSGKKGDQRNTPIASPKNKSNDKRKANRKKK